MSPRINLQSRKTKTTVLIVGEGGKDKAFLRHLQDIYVSREDNIAVKVECGAGGSPRSIIEKSIRLRDVRAYDRCVVVLDADRVLETDGKLKKRMKEKPPIEIIWVIPCMEALCLEIIEHPNFTRSKARVDLCKHEFSSYIPVDRQTEKHFYARIFPKTMLDYRRAAIQDLDAILTIMQI
ncbi:MAG: hypothetical protein KKC39_08410 [Candidatus Omnitrophica bacterium]|nr:hypothetical protein [Candidatus Omnitrophota bacterium]MBU4302870.1 hypothetical protein [Candidatus Omnitrophota bacterium]MBU4468740.1 hypothetical protein [Candidatus Omnitrophota bacterium]MCG2708232.1 hypothetical protein [Candidatus Omnitrophota bacterium]